MQEFSSISVSSFEASSLADSLTAQARDGWSVVAIVPTGSTITAYLSREATGDAAHIASAEPVAAYAAGAVTHEVDDAVTAEAASADTLSASVVAEPAAMPHVSAPAADEPSIPAATDFGASSIAAAAEAVAADPDPSPVEEPAGWAIAPEPASSSPVESAASYDTSSYDTGGYSASSYDTGAVADTSSYGAGEGSASSESTAASYDTSSYQASSYDSGAASAATESTAAAAASAAPAGWYADPSSRFELRYWDGTQWTEHVSRAGQQYTDPPVA